MTKRGIFATVAMLGLAIGGAPTMAQAGHGSGHGSKGGMKGHAGCPMGMGLMGEDVELAVEKLDDGATIRITSDDPQRASRIQKQAEIMRLLHELHQDDGRGGRQEAGRGGRPDR